MNFEELREKIEQWGKDKGIVDERIVFTQMAKVTEEVGELAKALIKHDRQATVDSIGDVLVTIIILSASKGLKAEYCLGYAWEQIKNRTGHLSPEGSFIKDEVK